MISTAWSHWAGDFYVGAIGELRWSSVTGQGRDTVVQSADGSSEGRTSLAVTEDTSYN